MCVCMCGSCMNDLVACILIFSCILYTMNTFHMIDFYHDLFCLYILRRFILLMLLNRCSSFVNYNNKYLSSDTLLKLSIFSSLLFSFPQICKSIVTIYYYYFRVLLDFYNKVLELFLYSLYFICNSKFLLHG